MWDSGRVAEKRRGKSRNVGERPTEEAQGHLTVGFSPLGKGKSSTLLPVSPKGDTLVPFPTGNSICYSPSFLLLPARKKTERNRLRFLPCKKERRGEGKVATVVFL